MRLCPIWAHSRWVGRINHSRAQISLKYRNVAALYSCTRLLARAWRYIKYIPRVRRRASADAHAFSRPRPAATHISQNHRSRTNSNPQLIIGPRSDVTEDDEQNGLRLQVYAFTRSLRTIDIVSCETGGTLCPKSIFLVAAQDGIARACMKSQANIGQCDNRREIDWTFKLTPFPPDITWTSRVCEWSRWPAPARPSYARSLGTANKEAWYKWGLDSLFARIRPIECLQNVLLVFFFFVIYK
jgi:hypothetical protein